METFKVLVPDQIVEFTSSEGNLVRFQLNVEKPSLVKIDTWPLDLESDPDLFVSAKHFDVDREKCEWKSENIGADCVTILPSDPNFSTGTLNIAVTPFRTGLNRLAIKAKVTESHEINEIPNNDYQNFTLKDKAYFKYNFQSTNFD